MNAMQSQESGHYRKLVTKGLVFVPFSVLVLDPFYSPRPAFIIFCSCVLVTLHSPATPPRRASYATPPGTPTLQRRTCFELFERNMCPPDSPLMQDCSRFRNVQVELQRRNSDASVRILPSNPSSTTTNKDNELTHADIQRLMMNNGSRLF